MSILKVTSLIKEYKETNKRDVFRALNGINLSVERSEFVAVMGPSGSGKTTLLNVLSGIDQDFKGSVEIGEVDLGEMSGDELALFRRRRMGFVFQNYNLLDSLTLRQNIMLPLILDDKDTDLMDQRADELLNLFDLAEFKDRFPYSVSGGQQQRAGIARAVINEPDIIFADEPTGNLDSKSSVAVMKCFTKLNTLQETTILLVTHDPFAASYCNRVIFMKDGVLVASLEKEQMDRKAFFEVILESLAELGGKEDDL